MSKLLSLSLNPVNSIPKCYHLLWCHSTSSSCERHYAESLFSHVHKVQQSSEIFTTMLAGNRVKTLSLDRQPLDASEY